MHAQYKMFPSESQFLLKQRGSTGRSLAGAQIQTSCLMSPNWEEDIAWCFLNPALSYHVLRKAWVTTGLTPALRKQGADEVDSRPFV